MLAAHPGIGFVVVATEHGPVALGRRGHPRPHDRRGRRRGPAGASSARMPSATSSTCRRTPNAPDIYVNSLYDPVLDEVAAFEELVGCHGGLGGWQTRPLLVHPAEWAIDEDLARRPRPAARGRHGAPPAGALARAARPPHEPGTGRAGRRDARVDGHDRPRRGAPGSGGNRLRLTGGGRGRGGRAQPEERARGRSARPGCAERSR